jgi:hypothetical protein
VRFYNDPMQKWSNELNRGFSMGEAKKQMKKCSASLAIKECKLKAG